MSKKLKIGLLLGGAFFLIYITCLYLFNGISSHHNDYFKYDGDRIVFTTKRPRDWVSLPNISSRAIWPIIISEDWGFYEHSGVDLRQLYIVIKEVFSKGELGRGASTITQQLVKNLYLNSNRSLIRKFNELILALILEKKVSKRWILEQYVNLVEFGPNVHGIREASKKYFNKSPDQLSYKDGAFLAMLLPSPVKYSESYDEKKLTEFAKEKIESILSKLVLAQIITKEEKNTELLKTFYWEEYKDIPEEDEYLHP